MPYLALFSCKKNTQCTNTRIIGKITNKITGDPVPNAEIKLNRSFNGHFAGVTEYVTSFYSNENGEYDYKFHAEKKAEQTDYQEKLEYWIEPYIPFNECVQYSGYFYINGECRASKDLKEGHKNEINIEYEPYAPAWLQIHIYNQNPFDENDKICISYGIPYSNCPLPITDNNGCFLGTSVNTTVLIKLFSGSWAVVWNITKNNFTQTDWETFQIPANDTIFYEITY